MPAPKRTKLERERDLQLISERYLKGQLQSEIGEALGVSQTQISRDIKELRKRWLETSMRDFDEMRAHELAKLDTLEAEHWRAWERSVGLHKKITRESGIGPQGAIKKESVTTEQLPGDPRHLEGVRKCIERRCRMLGFDAPQKIAPTDPNGDKPYEPESLIDRARRIAALLDKARERRDRNENQE